ASWLILFRSRKNLMFPAKNILCDLSFICYIYKQWIVINSNKISNIFLIMNGLAEKKEIIRQLKEKILTMEGFSTGQDNRQPDFGLGPVNASFPGGTFPTGAIHEFISPTETHFAAANGFITGLLGTLLKK